MQFLKKYCLIIKLLWIVLIIFFLILLKFVYFLGVLNTTRMYLKPNAVPSLRLKLGMTKPERLKKIRKNLFEQDSDSSSSSLCLSLLDESTENLEDFCEQSQEILNVEVKSTLNFEEKPIAESQFQC